MAPWTTQSINLPRRKIAPLSKLPIFLALFSSFLILLYVSFSLTKNISSPFFHVDHPPILQAQEKFSIIASDDEDKSSISPLPSFDSFFDQNEPLLLINDSRTSIIANQDDLNFTSISQEVPLQMELHNSPNGKTHKIKEDEVYHDEKIFLKTYKEMKKSLKIYIYPHNQNDPFAHALLPQDYEPSGNYASESYFKIELYKSHFITKDPSEADFFYLPFSIASLRHDKRVGVGGISDFVMNYMNNVTQNYPYWNRTGGTDHFYAACHSISKVATEKVNFLKSNAIQVVCSSSYFLANYFAHKDVCLPQVWPRHDEPPEVASTSQRKKLAFYAGTGISPLRKVLVQTWGNDSSIAVHGGRLKTPYSEQLLESKFCLHVKGFEVNTARIGDAMYYGCVPVILADYYDLPFMDILNWKSFSVVVTASDIPNLKRILQSISPERYSVLQANVLKVRKHFQWHNTPLDFDAFHMTMYELWLRRSSVRIMS